MFKSRLLAVAPFVEGVVLFLVIRINVAFSESNFSSSIVAFLLLSEGDFMHESGDMKFD